MSCIRSEAVAWNMKRLTLVLMTIDETIGHQWFDLNLAYSKIGLAPGDDNFTLLIIIFQQDTPSSAT
jgi:hypothetical protein